MMDINPLPKRVAQHVLEAQAERYLGSILPPEWTVNKPVPDYGEDFVIEIFTREGASFTPTGNKISVQLKAHGYFWPPKKEVYRQQIATSTLNYLHQLGNPSMLILYIREYVAKSFVPKPVPDYDFAPKDEQLYFVYIQPYINDILNRFYPRWKRQKSITVYVPSDNRLIEHLPLIRSVLKQPQRMKQMYRLQECRILPAVRREARTHRIVEIITTEKDCTVLAEALRAIRKNDAQNTSLQKKVRQLALHNNDYYVLLEAIGALKFFTNKKTADTLFQIEERLPERWAFDVVEKYLDTPGFFPYRSEYLEILEAIFEACIAIGDGKDERFTWLLLNEFLYPQRFDWAIQAGLRLLRYLPKCDAHNLNFIRQDLEQHHRKSKAPYSPNRTLKQNINDLIKFYGHQL